MKKERTILLPIIFCFMWVGGLTAQNISYNYDASGNRTLRTISLKQIQSDSSLFNQLSYENEEINGIKVNISPNPNTGKFNINIKDCDYKKNMSVYIHNSVGILIYNKKLRNKKTEIDISSKENGIYFLSLIVEDKTYIKKIVKQ